MAIRIDRVYKTIHEVPVRKKPTDMSRLLQRLDVGTRIHATKATGRWIYVPALKGWTKRTKADGERLVKLVKEESTGERLCAALDRIGDQLKTRPMRWTSGGHSGTLAGALKSHKLDCSHYASYGLQAIGVLSKGKCIWLTTKICGKGAGDLKRHAAKVYHPNRRPKDCGLKVGDVVGFTSPQHTMVYAGRKSGHMMWYSGGGGDIRHKSYGPKRKQSYENKIVRTVVRLK